MRFFRCLFLWGAIFFYQPVFATETIAVIHSYPPGEWFHGIQGALRNTSRALGLEFRFEPIVFHAEYWFRRPPKEMEKERDRILAQIRSLNAKAVVLCDDEAADVFSVALYRSEFPLFLLGINRKVEELPWWNTVRDRAALVLESYPVDQLFTSLRRISPDSRKINLISSDNPTSRIIVDRIQKEWPKIPHRAPFEIGEVFRSDSWQQWKAYLSSLAKVTEKRSTVVWILVPYDVRDIHGVEVKLERIGRWMREELVIPSLGLSSVHPKMGVLLTVAVTPQQLAKATVEQVNAWKKGSPFSRIPVRVENRGQLHINLDTANRLRLKIPQELFSVSKIIPESNLPYGR